MHLAFLCALATLLAELQVGAVEGDVQDLVVLGAERPVFLRLHIQLDGVGFRKLQPQLVERLFNAFDADQNGQWSTAELEAARKSGRLSILGNDGTFDPQALDKDDDGQLSQSEFSAHALPALGPPCLLRSDSSSTARLVPLFQRVDADEDGRLSIAELRRLATSVRKLDLDDDEVLSLPELTPPPSNGLGPTPSSNSSPADSPVLMISPESQSDIARTLLKRYGKRGRLPVSVLNLSPQLAAQVDADQNGAVSQVELLKLLADPPVAREVLVKLPRMKERTIDVRVLGDKSPARGRARSALVLLGGIATEIRGATVARDVSDNRAYYRIEFLRADADKNKYLNEAEFAMVGLEGSFAQVDRNGDKMVVEEEILEHLALSDQLNESRIELLVSNENQGLFELLDINFDQRISPREFHAAVSTLQSRDKNQDGLVDSAELGNKYRLTVSLNKPKLFQKNAAFLSPSNTAGRPPRITTAGPTWFSRMDKNGDGDVSQREFLGPLATFQKLDTDHNGVIDPTEAAK